MTTPKKSKKYSPETKERAVRLLKESAVSLAMMFFFSACSSDEVEEPRPWTMEEPNWRCTPGSDPERCADVDCLEFQPELTDLGRILVRNTCPFDLYLQPQMGDADMSSYWQGIADGKVMVMPQTYFWILGSEDEWPARVPATFEFGPILPGPEEVEKIHDCRAPRGDIDETTEITLSLVMRLPTRSDEREDLAVCPARYPCRTIDPPTECLALPNFFIVEDILTYRLADLRQVR